MKTTNDKKSRSICARIGKLAAGAGFALLIGAMATTGSALAARHGDGGHGGNHGGGYHGSYHGGYHGGGHWGGWGGGYYAPGPDIYVAPEPYAYADPCYGPYYNEECGPPPSPGVNLFFGL